MSRFKDMVNNLTDEQLADLDMFWQPEFFDVIQVFKEGMKYGKDQYLRPHGKTMSREGNFNSISHHLADWYAGNNYDRDSTIHCLLKVSCRSLMGYVRHARGIQHPEDYNDYTVMPCVTSYDGTLSSIIDNPHALYLAVPYSHPKESVRDYREEAVTNLSGELHELGLNVYSPITHSEALRKGSKLVRSSWDDWKHFDETMLARCDAILVYRLDGWEESIGVRGELEFARLHNIPVFYVDDEHTPDGVADTITIKDEGLETKFQHSSVTI